MYLSVFLGKQFCCLSVSGSPFDMSQSKYRASFQYKTFPGKSENPNIKNWPNLKELSSAFTRHTSVDAIRRHTFKL